MANDKEHDRAETARLKLWYERLSHDVVPQPKGGFKDLFQELQKKSKEAENQRPSKEGNPSK